MVHMPRSMIELALSVLPKHKLTKEDLLDKVSFHEVQKVVEREALLHPERADPTSRQQLISTFRDTTELGEETLEKGRCLLVTVAYPMRFSAEKLENLTRIDVSDMLVRKTHNGNYLLCRTVFAPIYDFSICVLLAVEDPRGNTCYIKLFNYALLADVGGKGPGWLAIIPVGTILAIREPHYAANQNVPELPFVKVDSPSDLVFLDEDHPLAKDVSWSTSPEAVYNMKLSPKPKTGEAWKAKAVGQFKQKEWLASAISFTNCIKVGFDVPTSRLNRSEVYLRLGWNNSAFHDAMDAYSTGTFSDDLKKKAVVRMLKALYAARKFEAVLENAKKLPNDEVVVDFVNRATRRLREQQTGKYDWAKLHSDNEKGVMDMDVGDFTGPVEVKKGPNGLRGTFVTRNVKAGELLMLHKPICCRKDKEEDEFIGKIHIVNLPMILYEESRDRLTLSYKAVRKIWDDQRAYALIRSLYGGISVTDEPSAYPPPDLDGPPLSHPTQPVVDIDMEYIFGAVSANSFGIGSNGSKANAFYGAPSLVNHSCLPTAQRVFYGDVLVMRATQDMKKGDEVTVAYIEAYACYDEKRFRLMNTWKFTCECELCEADDEDGYDARDTRRALKKQLDNLDDSLKALPDAKMSSSQAKSLVAEAKKTCDEISRTYNSKHAEKARGVKPELGDALMKYAKMVQMQSAHSSSANDALYKRLLNLRFDSLEANGVKVIDRSVTGVLMIGNGGKEDGKKKKTPSLGLPIDSSKILLSDRHFYVIETVIWISYLFNMLGDVLRAQRWMNAAERLEVIDTGGGAPSLRLEERRGPLLNLLNMKEYVTNGGKNAMVQSRLGA